MTAVVDNDVVFKATLYDLCEELITDQYNGQQVGILGAAKFVLSPKIAKLPQNASGAIATRFAKFLSKLETIEPSEEEIAVAGELEAVAQDANLALDVGESQLCAVFLLRNLNLLITGDKRAITAMEALLPVCQLLAGLQGKVKCFEQCVLDALNKLGDYDQLRNAICAVPNVDKAMTICFSCLAATQNEEVTRACLDSYIRNLRGFAGNILCA